jgi:hypothetical protein
VLSNNRYDESGVYELICQNCPGTYIGQTGRNFETRFKEHVQDIKNNKSKIGFAHHILNTGHAYDNIENTLKILNIQGKGTGKVPHIQNKENRHVVA